MNQTLTLVVADVNVSQDQHGRFSLNDLHRAAGAKPKQRPGLWLRSDQAKDLIVQIENSADLQSSDGSTAQIRAVETTQGNSGGTFVVRELVYAYAMWISAAFQMKVIRAYDAMVRAAGLDSQRVGSARPQASSVYAGVRQRSNLVRLLADSANAVVARGYYRCLQLVDAELGIETEPIADLAPITRQAGLPGVPQ